MDSHNISFFGQKSGIIMWSHSRSNNYIHLRFLKKKPNGSWEKPSSGEGKSIKLNLREIIMLLDVLANKSKKWSTVHRFKGESTPITVENQEKAVVFAISGYLKPLNYPESKIMFDLLKHIYEEKIK